MGTEEKIAIRLGAVTPWSGGSLSIKGFSGTPGEEYAKVIVRDHDGSRLVRVGLGETEAVSDTVSIRLDEVPPSSSATPGPTPTGGRTVQVAMLRTEGM